MNYTPIRRFRLLKGLTQERMARVIDVTLTTYTKAEKSGIAGRIFIEKMLAAFPEDDVISLFYPRRNIAKSLDERKQHVI